MPFSQIWILMPKMVLGMQCVWCACSLLAAYACNYSNYAFPSSGEAYRDQQLTTNFGALSWNFLCADMFPYEDSKTLSVRPSVRPSVCLSVPREKKSPWLRQYQSYISNSYINGKVITSTTTCKPKIFIFFLQKSLKFEFWLVTKSWNHISFVNISPTLVIDIHINGKVFTGTTTWKSKKCEFHKIKVAKARKNSSLRWHFPRLYIGVA